MSKRVAITSDCSMSSCAAISHPFTTAAGRTAPQRTSISLVQEITPVTSSGQVVQIGHQGCG